MTTPIPASLVSDDINQLIKSALFHSQARLHKTFTQNMHCSQLQNGQNGNPRETFFFVKWGPFQAEMGNHNAYFVKLNKMSRF